MSNKFRVWDSKNNKYFEPTYKAYEGNVAELLINMDGQLLLRTFGQISHESTFPNRFVLELYIGQKDDDDKEVYVGDIMSNGRDYGQVVFENGFEFRINGEYTETLANFNMFHTFSIIGNIHENPELLKGE